MKVLVRQCISVCFQANSYILFCGTRTFTVPGKIHMAKPALLLYLQNSYLMISNRLTLVMGTKTVDYVGDLIHANMSAMFNEADLSGEIYNLSWGKERYI